MENMERLIAKVHAPLKVGVSLDHGVPLRFVSLLAL